MVLLRRAFAAGVRLSPRAAVDVAGVSLRNVRPYLALLHETGEIRIVRWVSGGRGPLAPEYAANVPDELGERLPDEPYPAKSEIAARRAVRRSRRMRAAAVLRNPYLLLRTR